MKCAGAQLLCALPVYCNRFWALWEILCRCASRRGERKFAEDHLMFDACRKACPFARRFLVSACAAYGRCCGETRAFCSDLSAGTKGPQTPPPAPALCSRFLRPLLSLCGQVYVASLNTQMLVQTSCALSALCRLYINFTESPAAYISPAPTSKLKVLAASWHGKHAHEYTFSYEKCSNLTLFHMKNAAFSHLFI